MKIFNQSILVISLAFYMTLASLPAKAETQAKEKPNSFLTQFEQVFTSLQKSIKKYSKSFALDWESISKELQTAIDSSQGDLGTPDPLSSGERIRLAIAREKQKQQDLVTTPPETLGENAERKWHQQYTLAQSQSTLGTDGQKVQAQEAEISNQAVATSSENAETVQSDIVTQDILKKIAIQNLQGAIITKSMHVEAQKQSRALAAANINLADMSGNMDEETKRKQAESTATAKGILRSAAALDAFWENQ